MDQLEQIQAMEKNAVLVNTHNTQHERNKSNLNRSATRARKVAQATAAQDKIDEINAQMVMLKEQLKSIKSTNGIKRTTPTKTRTNKSKANLSLAAVAEVLEISDCEEQQSLPSSSQSQSHELEDFQNQASSSTFSFDNDFQAIDDANSIHGDVFDNTSHHPQPQTVTPTAQRIYSLPGHLPASTVLSPVSAFVQNFGYNHSPSRHNARSHNEEFNQYWS
jgi:hypothetical protein